MPQTDKNINFDDLFRYNYRPLCMYALHYLQDVFLKLFRSSENLKFVRNVKEKRKGIQ
jgi:hypothetical protein